ncbi:MAG: substrate-binding domain-containing protein [Acidobacteria bacterium]|nr:substrate-binding domain-containing protein [Acidobacteriota bacterium]
MHFRIWAGASALALFFSLAGCNQERKTTIGVIPKGRAHLFWQSVHAGAAKAAMDAGVEIQWNGPTSETDYAGQIQIMENMMTRRLDAICVAPIDKKIMVAVVERASKAGIPVVIFDSGIDTAEFVSQVATDNYAAGRMAADRMAAALNGKGKVVIVAVQPGAASTMERERGFEEAVKEKYPGIRIADKQFGLADFAKSLAVSENMLTAHPDLDGMFASNESSTVGASQAVKGRKAKLKLVGFDWSPTLLQDLREGVIDSLVVQHPFKMGEDSVRVAIAKLRGQAVVKMNNLAPRLVLKEDLDKPDVQAQLNPDLKKYLGQ